MVVGFASGKLFFLDGEKQKKLYMQIGMASVILFIIIRSINIYGDTALWSMQRNGLFTFLSFITMITCEVIINVPVGKVWELWTSPVHIAEWNIPFPHWHTPKVENDLQTGGKFFYRMEDKNGKEGFDYTGTYERVVPFKLIKVLLTDGRKSTIQFIDEADTTIISETFEPEGKTPIDIQKKFCQSVLNNFKNYSEKYFLKNKGNDIQ